MRDLFRYIIIASALSMALLSLNSCREEGIIDEEDMAQIYAEMLLTDQWINTTPGVRMIADTSLVYEPILKKYGYTSADYRKSVDYYLNDPRTYADIMKETIKILDAKLVGLNQRKKEQEAARAREQYIKDISRDIKIGESWNAMSHIDDEPFGPDDSLTVAWDTVSYCFSIVRLPKAAVSDTLSVTDSMMVEDSLEKIGSFKELEFKKPESLKIDGDLIKKSRI